MSTRRRVVQGLAGLGLAGNWRGTLAGISLPPAEQGLTEAVAGSAEWLTLPGKVPLIKRTFRPPNLETPLEYFRDPITPNRAFFVRYHHAVIPAADRSSWTLKVGGPAAARALRFSMADLQRQFEIVEVTALCLCSGNRRGLFAPHVTGVQWGSGAMGNARWRGVRLKDVLEKAGVRPDALEVAFDGNDVPALPLSPDYQKSLPLAKALAGEVLIALEMNGERLPPLHGAPARLVVPGWTATYWIKHLSSIELRSTPSDNFWVKTGYRLPAGKFSGFDRFPSQETAVNTPITGIAVNSLITAPAAASRVQPGGHVDLRGVAWDGGQGLARVEVSIDQGHSWSPATLDSDLGTYSLRPWSFRLVAPKQAGRLSAWVKATSRNGTTQPLTAAANPAGYHHNQIQVLELKVA